MTFLAPLLAGLTALGLIPIIIWLLNRQRFRVIEWPAVEFLLKVLKQSSRRLQLRELILLILRTLAVVFAALALARPTVAGGAFELMGLRGGVSAIVVLDNSLSMAVRDGNESRFELAKARATEVVSHLPRGSGAALVLMSDVAIAELAEPSQDLTYVAQAIAAAPQGDGGTSISAGLSRAWEIAKAVTHGRKEIYLITDLQGRSWPAADDRAWKALVTELGARQDLSLFIADVADGKRPENIAIQRFAPDDDLVTTDAPAAFTAILMNRGAAVSDLSVELWVDDAKRELRKAAATVVDRLEGSREVRLEARILEGGLHRVQLRIGADRLPNDNQQQAVVEAVDRVRVLVVDGADGERGGGSEFLRAALAPRKAVEAAEGQQGVAHLFAIDVVGAKGIAAIKLDDYQAVIVNDLAEPPAGFGDALRTWVAGGRGLVLMPGSRSQAAAWNPGLAAVLPAKLSAQPRDLKDDKGAPGLGLATTDLVHPVVSFFAAPEVQPFLAQPRFAKAWSLEPAAGCSPVLRFADGQPALVERPLGRGSVLLCAFPSDKQWGDLPLRPAFLMLMRRAVQHAALGNRPRLSVRVHDPLALTLPTRQAGARITARDPRGGTSVLNPGPGPDGTSRVELSETPFAGFYELGGAERPWRFAVNPPGDESDLDAISREAVGERLVPLTPAWIGAGDDAQARIDRARAGIEIWPFLFALAVACLVAESVLVVRWAPKPQAEGG